MHNLKIPNYEIGAVQLLTCYEMDRMNLFTLLWSSQRDGCKTQWKGGFEFHIKQLFPTGCLLAAGQGGERVVRALPFSTHRILTTGTVSFQPESTRWRGWLPRPRNWWLWAPSILIAGGNDCVGRLMPGWATRCGLGTWKMTRIDSCNDARPVEKGFASVLGTWRSPLLIQPV